MEKISRIDELVELINKLNIEYYTNDAPSVSDAQWDKLYDELLILQEQTGYIPENSPTKNVGAKLLTKFESKPHKSRMWSLDKSKTLEGILSWENRIKKKISEYENDSQQKLPKLKYTVEWKFDGLTISALYKAGTLQQVLTRGNGEIGEVITAQAKTIKTIPDKIDYLGEIEVQGECIMRLSVLDEINKNSDDKLKNARNAAAGALRNLDPEITKKRRLDAYFYNIGYNDGLDINNQGELFEFLNRNQFENQGILFECHDLNEFKAKADELEKLRKKLDFLVDGLVIKVWDNKTRSVLGHTEKFPRWAIAYKFEAEIVSTKINNITWEVGRTGKITPIALLEPVNIEGVTVSRATLNNFGDIQRKKVYIGADVNLRRSNDVIPEILGLSDENSEAKQVEPPTHCPYCNAKLEEIGANLFCINSFSCKPQIVGRLVHFASRNAMDIEFFSEKTAQQLFEELDISSIAQLYKIKKGDLVNLERFGEKKEENILNMIENSKQRPLRNFIYALGIPNVGVKNARELAKHYPNFDDLRKATIEELVNIPDIGEIVARGIVDFFNDEYISSQIDELLSLGVNPKADETSNNQEGYFSGKTVVLTGTLEDYSRNDAAKVIEEMGGKITGSVSKKTNIVLFGDQAGSKLEKARALGVYLMDENEFKDIILRK